MRTKTKIINSYYQVRFHIRWGWITLKRKVKVAFLTIYNKCHKPQKLTKEQEEEALALTNEVLAEIKAEEKAHAERSVNNSKNQN